MTPHDAFVVLSIALCFARTEADYPFRNTSLPWSQRVDDLVSRLTLEEMKDQMARGGAGPRGGPAPSIKRLGIGPYSWNTECLRGDVAAGSATSFPQALGLAATFSPDLIFRVAEATGVEVRAKYNDYVKHGQYGDHKGLSCFSPVINIMRDPRWGRNQETYGEDPYLSGVLATNFVKGLQGNNSRYIRANAGCKHFNVHGGPENIPVSRLSFNAKVSERDWRTTFLPAFRSCVKAGSYSLMCSYNRINGTPACANEKLLTQILRDEWGFTGYVVSDEGAIENIIKYHHYFNNSVDTAAACINAGCNLELSPDRADPIFFSIIDAINKGILSEDVIRDRVKPLFNTRMRLGEFDPPKINPYSKLNLSVIQNEAHRNLSVEAAMKSFVLLKNTGILPLQMSRYNNISIVGPMANNYAQMFGDYSPTPNLKYTKTPFQALSSLAKNVKFAPGCTDNRCTHYNPKDIQMATSNTDLIFVCLGTGQEIESEGNDRPNLNLPGNQSRLLQDVLPYGSATPVILLLFNAGPVNISLFTDNLQVAAILELFFPAQATGEALRRVLLNDGRGAVPAGRLPYTWPKYSYQIPDMTNYTMAGRTYRYFSGTTLWPFGFGLSYTKFSYRYIQYTSVIKAGEDLRGKTSIMNGGQFDAEEVLQVYISWVNASVPVPKLQLAYFQRVVIPAKSERTCNFTISAQSMAVWVDSKGWTIEPGLIWLFVGGQQPGGTPSVGSNVLDGQFKVKSSRMLGKY